MFRFAIVTYIFSHTWCGDLSVKLTLPAGKEVVFHNRTDSIEVR
ncbi:MAG: proprotein convertase P-domain-containing protein [Parashewanella sp.]